MRDITIYFIASAELHHEIKKGKLLVSECSEESCGNIAHACLRLQRGMRKFMLPLCARHLGIMLDDMADKLPVSFHEELEEMAKLQDDKEGSGT